MTEAAVANPSLTVGELVDKTTEKLEFMAGYMEGAARSTAGSWSMQRSSSRSRRSI